MFILITSLISAQEGTQNIIEHTVPTFTGIDAGSLSNVYITIGSVQSVKMENEHEGTTIFKVKNGILEIRIASRNKLNNRKIYITCPYLNYIKTSGVSRVKSQNTVKADLLSIKASGASKIEIDIDVQSLNTDIYAASKLTLKGSATQHKANLSGAAKLNANELTVLRMEVNGSGAAKANVNVKNELLGELSGVSSVNYKEKPEIVNLSGNNIHKSKKHHSDFDSEDTTKVSLFGNSTKIIEIIDGKDTKISVGNIEIIDGKDTKISVGNTEMVVDDSGNFKIRKKDKNKPYKHKFRGHWAGFELAFNGYVNKDFGTAIPTQYEFLELNDVKSIGVNLNLLEFNGNIINNRFGVVSGIGFQWNNYRFKDNNVVLSPDSATIYGYNNIAIDSYIKSKLVESWVRVPVFLEYQTAKRKGKQFHIAVGGVFGYKIGSHSKQVHFEDGGRSKDKVHDSFYLNPIKLDAEVRIGWGPINLFASYAVTPMFKENKGPKVYPYMLGITLAGW